MIHSLFPLPLHSLSTSTQLTPLLLLHRKWWPASTAIPLLVATIGPLSHVLSIASLVTTWKATLPNSGILPDGKDYNGIGIPDPKWEINANILSLICGFAGNFFLLLNFTGKVRYVVAVPAAVGAWMFSSGIVSCPFP